MNKILEAKNKIYMVTYSYQTWKSNYREKEIIIKAPNKYTTKQLLKEWSKSQRTILNVEILSIKNISELDSKAI